MHSIGLHVRFEFSQVLEPLQLLIEVERMNIGGKPAGQDQICLTL